MPEADVGKMEGWVEVIVYDKNGRIKHHIMPAFVKKCEDGEHCSTIPTISPPFPAKLAEYYWRKNVITNVGLAAIIRLVFSGLTENKFGYLAIGTGTNAESVNDTTLQNEIKRKAATVTQTTTNVDGDTAMLEATFSSSDGLSGSNNISEAGIFNADSDGILLARKVFTPVPINWDVGDSITIRYFIQMSR
jgi:hypothetical protein